jgi:hypothetical protein
VYNNFEAISNVDVSAVNTYMLHVSDVDLMSHRCKRTARAWITFTDCLATQHPSSTATSAQSVALAAAALSRQITERLCGVRENEPYEQASAVRHR